MQQCSSPTTSIKDMNSSKTSISRLIGKLATSSSSPTLTKNTLIQTVFPSNSSSPTITMVTATTVTMVANNADEQQPAATLPPRSNVNAPAAQTWCKHMGEEWRQVVVHQHCLPPSLP